MPVGELAVRMAKAGAQIVGVNCLFDPFITLEVMRKMKEALDAFELSPYLMAQPNGYRVPDGGSFGWCEVSASHAHPTSRHFACADPRVSLRNGTASDHPLGGTEVGPGCV